MLFKHRHQPRNFAVGLMITASDLQDASDDLHDRENASIAQTKREAAQKRELAKARREKRKNRVMFSTPFNGDEYAEQQDLMQYLRR